MIANQTFQPITPNPAHPIFQMFIRHIDDGTTLHTPDNYADVMGYCTISSMKAWQLRRWDNVQKKMVMIACSTNWFTATPASTSRWIENQQMEVMDGLMVIHEPQRDYVYFTDKARLHDSYIKIYNRHSVTIVGNVTSDNYAGFLKAAALAQHFMSNKEVQS